MRNGAMGVLAAAIVVAGCTDEDHRGAVPKPPPPVVVTVAPQAAPAPLAVEVLADGSVDNDEMRIVLEATMACIRDAGFDATLDSFEPGGGWSATYGAGSDEAAARCEAELVHSVEFLYSEQHGPTDAEIARHNRATVECLRARGYELPVETSLQEAFRLVEASDFAACEDV